MFSILAKVMSLNKKFCSQMDGAHCVKSDTTEEEEANNIGESNPAIAHLFDSNRHPGTN